MTTNIELIRKGTDCALVAKNWHMQGVVKSIRDDIAEQEQCVAQLVESGLDVGTLGKELEGPKAELRAFLEKWPAPTITPIEDTVIPLSTIQSEWLNVPLAKARPLVPLVCRSDSKRDSHLFYEERETGKIHKVVNFWYNQPNQAKVVRFLY